MAMEPLGDLGGTQPACTSFRSRPHGNRAQDHDRPALTLARTSHHESIFRLLATAVPLVEMASLQVLQQLDLILSIVRLSAQRPPVSRLLDLAHIAGRARWFV